MRQPRSILHRVPCLRPNKDMHSAVSVRMHHMYAYRTGVEPDSGSICLGKHTFDIKPQLFLEQVLRLQVLSYLCTESTPVGSKEILDLELKTIKFNNSWKTKLPLHSDTLIKHYERS
jgi:hypothetical protein